MSNYPAAKYAYEYKTTGTNAGEWYLPTLGELNTVYSNKDYMNYALSVAGKKDILGGTHWSSSVYANYGVETMHFSDGVMNGYLKDDDHYVLPVLAF